MFDIQIWKDQAAKVDALSVADKASIFQKAQAWNAICKFMSDNNVRWNLSEGKTGTEAMVNTIKAFKTDADRYKKIRSQDVDGVGDVVIWVRSPVDDLYTILSEDDLDEHIDNMKPSK